MTVTDRPHISVEPLMRFGQPHIRGVPVDTVVGMVAAGETVAVVADEHGLSRAEVLLACWHAGTHGTKRYRRRYGPWAEGAYRQLWDSQGDWAAVDDPPDGGAP